MTEGYSATIGIYLTRVVHLLNHGSDCAAKASLIRSLKYLRALTRQVLGLWELVHRADAEFFWRQPPSHMPPAHASGIQSLGTSLAHHHYSKRSITMGEFASRV
jgi:hypothetical protein